MENANWVNLVVSVIVIGVTITVALIGIIFRILNSKQEAATKLMVDKLDSVEQKIELRLRTLGHEDRDIRTQLTSVSTLVIQALGQLKNGN